MSQLKTIRVQRGLTIVDVAQRVQVSPSNLRRYENGLRSLPVEVAQGLGLVYEINWWQLYPNYYPDGLKDHPM